MKKLLAVAALLAVGATSFGAVTKEVEQKNGYTSVALPVGVRGNVVVPTNLMLEVMAVKSAGVNGDRLEFDFADMVKGGSKQTLEGTFEARLRDPQGAEVKFATAPVYSLDDRAAAFDDAKNQTVFTGTQTKNLNNAATMASTKNVAIDYTLNTTKGLAGELVNKGTLAVTADTAKADEGVFTTSEIDIRVIIKNQDNTGADII